MDGHHVSFYFDYNATTPVSLAVSQEMESAISLFANCSSNNSYSVANNTVVKNSRKCIAQLLGTKAEKVVFTSGGTEANNWAIKGTLFQLLSKPGHIISTAIEHASVLDTLKYCTEQFGFEVTYLKPHQDGAISVSDFLSALRPDTQLVTIMYANNETGVIQPVAEIAQIIGERNIKFHVDGVQVVGKRKVNVERLGVDYLSFSAHKFYGPKGIGGLYIKDINSISPLIHGGGQEMAMRSGTENLVAIQGFSKAAEECIYSVEDWDAHYWDCKQYLMELLQASNIEAHYNGATEYDKSISNTLNLTIPGIRGEALAALVEKKYGFIISIGSACSNNIQSKSLSHVLMAMDVSETDIQASIRVSIGLFTHREDIAKFVTALESCVELLMKISNGV